LKSWKTEFEERSSIKDDILEGVFEEAKEENLELIEENGENLKSKILGISWKIQLKSNMRMNP
jgi:hypothetical protein